MSEYLCFEVEVDQERTAVVVSDVTLRACFDLAAVTNDLNHLYTRYREPIHQAAMRRARSSPDRPVVLRTDDLGEPG